MRAKFIIPIIESKNFFFRRNLKGHGSSVLKLESTPYPLVKWPASNLVSFFYFAWITYNFRSIRFYLEMTLADRKNWWGFFSLI
jgi:hypothetical protein